MQNSIWKLTTLAGVIGATCLAVVLLQRNAPEPESDLLDPVAEAELETANGSSTASDETVPPPSQPSEPPLQSPEPTGVPTLVADNDTPPVHDSDPAGGIDFNALPPDFENQEPSQDTPTEAPDFDVIPQRMTNAEPKSVPVPDAILNGPADDSDVDDFPAIPEFPVAESEKPEAPATESSTGLQPTEVPDLMPAATAATEQLDEPSPSAAAITTADADSGSPFADGPALIGGAPTAGEPVIQTAGEFPEDPFGAANPAPVEQPETPPAAAATPEADPFGGDLFPPLEDAPGQADVARTADAPETSARQPAEPLDDFPALGLDNPDLTPAEPTPAELNEDPFARSKPPADSGSAPAEDGPTEVAADDKPSNADAFDPFALDARAREQPAAATPEPASPAAAEPAAASSDFPALDNPFGPEPTDPSDAAAAPADSTPAKIDDFPALEPEPEPAGAAEFPALEPAPSEAEGPSEVDFPTLPALPSTAEQPAPVEPQPLPEFDGGPTLATPDTSASSEPPGEFPNLESSADPVAETQPEPRVATSEAPPATTDSALVGDATFDPSVQQKSLRPQLRIEKSAPETAVLGKPFVYHILVSNVGTTDATNVVVRDRIPKGTELTGTIPRAELSESDKTLIWKYPLVAAGEQVRISIRVVPREQGSIGSVATVSSVAQVAAKTTITSPKLELELNSVSEAKLGAPVVYEFVIRNTGSGSATGVFIRNLVPDGLRHPEGNDLEYEVGELPPGESRSARLTLQTTRAGRHINRAVATADGGLKVEAQSTLEVAGHQLRLTRTGPKTRFVGKQTTFENEIANESSQPIQQAVVIETLPEGMEFVEASHGGHYDAAQRTVAWTIDRIDPQQKQTLELKVVPRQNGTQTSVVELREPNGNHSRTVTRTEVASYTSLGLDVSEVDRPVLIGERILMTIRARNRGSSNARNVRLRVQVPEQMEIVEVLQQKQPVQFQLADGQVLLPVVDSLAGRAQFEFEIMLKAKASADVRFGVEVTADELSAPVSREEAILIVPDGQE